ncbi:dol-P-Man:Man(6)GlcNAc(2)-PP-Dol alpha-1,2-mannosyltransferase-like isoform X2 [Zingiber officinale]|uniref:dol-P-Man:Man(6)GlcNAc(2)-PP-Dol alpha-1,2-mannosyltransferase-like isoform X2 n=1 Tax=Zingiber officinale TaxID=94328 RepID=UPI001C4C9DCF|nr:dol-P-Man:Man(6)GlcNAc(2)-PP-Dol alpha-1,2-mannosyltransferase-like isoform X2 [Zingiber officinale]
MTCSCDPVQLLTFIRISIASSLQSQFPLFESERESRPAMTLSVARQRRPRAEDQGASSSSSSASDRYWKEEKEKERAGVGWFLPSLLLGFLRHMSASSDIIHDCESATRSSITGNPSLHHLLYISGFQTWEYRFLYPIYPLICIAATVDIDSFPGLFRDKYAVEDSLIVMIAKGLRPIFLGIILCASHSP